MSANHKTERPHGHERVGGGADEVVDVGGRSRFIRNVSWAAAAAAVVLLAAALLWPDIDGEYTLTYWMPVEASALVRAQTADADDLDRALAAYDARDLGRALIALESAQSNEDNEALRKLYLANAYTHTRRHRDATLLLESIELRDVPQPWGNRGWWTLYIARRGAGQDEAASALLRRLTRESDDIGDMARAEQARLD